VRELADHLVKKVRFDHIKVSCPAQRALSKYRADRKRAPSRGSRRDGSCKLIHLIRERTKLVKEGKTSNPDTEIGIPSRERQGKERKITKIKTQVKRPDAH